MQAFDKADAAGMKKVEGEISKPEARILKLAAQEVRITGAINREKEKVDEGGMTERREEWKRLRRMEDHQRPKRKTRACQQKR